MTKSTKSSIGWTINGIEPSPEKVGAQLFTPAGMVENADLVIANLDARTIMLIVPPGIKTLANAGKKDEDIQHALFY